MYFCCTNRDPDILGTCDICKPFALVSGHCGLQDICGTPGFEGSTSLEAQSAIGLGGAQHAHIPWKPGRGGGSEFQNPLGIQRALAPKSSL